MTRASILRPVVLVAAILACLTPAAAQSSSDVSAQRIFDALGLREGNTVCEMGAGDGTLSIEAARLVGTKGRVYTSELGEGRVKTLEDKMAASGLTQITVVAGDPNKTQFPDGACDALFMRNVYHHFADPAAMDASIFASMKPAARVAVADFAPPGAEAASPADRAKDGMHGVSPDSVSRELKGAGFEPLSVIHESAGDRGFIVVMTKPRG